jgi:cytoskeletal protein RodZ
LQIGETLRGARLERGLEREAAARETKIRSRYLAALEEESFDLLPGEVYTRSFVREYAEFLGLDPKPLLEELASRFEAPEPPPLLPVHHATRPRRPGAIVLAAAAALAVGAAVLAAWSPGTGRHHPAPAAARTTRPAAQQVVTAAPARTATPPLVRLTASRGDCWLQVRKGTGAGAVLYQGLLRDGATLTFRARPLWLRVGAPWNLDVRIGGRMLGGMPSTTANVLVTASGLRGV